MTKRCSVCDREFTIKAGNEAKAEAKEREGKPLLCSKRCLAFWSERQRELDQMDAHGQGPTIGTAERVMEDR